MLSGRNNFYFMRASELPLMTAYCLVMALILSCLSIQDWLKNHNMEAATELLMSLLFGVYASYLSLADRT